MADGFNAVDCELQPLAEMAGKTRTLEDHFIAANGTDIADDFRLYLRPLRRSGMAYAFRLRAHPVTRVQRP